MKKIVIACLMFFFTYFSNTSIAQKMYTIKCEQIFYFTEQYWVKDSLGENGLRLLTAHLMKDCFDDIIKGKQWTELKGSFGNPNKELIKDSIKIYRYKLTHWANPTYLDIGVNDKGEVIKFLIWEIDG